MSVVHMSKFQEKLEVKISEGRKLLSIYLTLGYPSYEEFRELSLQVARHGADIIEIGIPFSDPMADGSIIQYTSQAAIDQGIQPRDTWDIVDHLKKHTDVSIVLMTYANIPYQYGLHQFATDAKIHEVDGFILPDLPIEHYPSELQDLDAIFLIPPNVTKNRIAELAKKCKGFIYVMSRSGITGTDQSTDSRLGGIYHHIKMINPRLPVLQGFGIRSKNQIIEALNAGADGVIIGSEILKLVGDDFNIDAAIRFIQMARETLDEYNRRDD